MDSVKTCYVYAKKDGQECSAKVRSVTLDVSCMDSVKTGPAYVWPVGMEDIAQLRDVQNSVVMKMGSVAQISMEIGVVNVKMDGTVWTAPLDWKQTAMMD